MYQASSRVPMDFSGYDACLALANTRQCGALLAVNGSVVLPYPTGVCVPANCSVDALNTSPGVQVGAAVVLSFPLAMALQ